MFVNNIFEIFSQDAVFRLLLYQKRTPSLPLARFFIDKLTVRVYNSRINSSYYKTFTA